MTTDGKKFRQSRKKYVWEKSNGICWYCGATLDPFTFHIDHMQPKAGGGRDRRENLVPSCPSCNLTKGRRSLEYLRMRLYWRQIGAPTFTPDQLEFLSEWFGVEFEPEAYVFWFEMEGLA